MKKILLTLIAISFISLSSLSQYFEGEIVFETETSLSEGTYFTQTYSYSSSNNVRVDVDGRNKKSFVIFKNDSIYLFI